MIQSSADTVICSGQGPVGVCSERGNKPSDCIKFGKISRVVDEIVSSTGGGV